MNTHIKHIGLAAIALCAVNAQAYKFGVFNHTMQPHNIEIMLNLPGETWQNLGMAMPLNSVERDFNFPDPRFGACLKDVHVDFKPESIKILAISKAEFEKVLGIRHTPKALGMLMNALDLPNVKNWNFTYLCKSNTFELIQTDKELILLLVLPSDQVQQLQAGEMRQRIEAMQRAREMHPSSFR